MARLGHPESIHSIDAFQVPIHAREYTVKAIWVPVQVRNFRAAGALGDLGSAEMLDGTRVPFLIH